jgi:oxaloacetate decarboxylase gamma subunit
MTIGEMLEQSGGLTLLGMGIVFSFLIILVISITLLGKIVRAIGADKDLRQPPAAPAGGAGTAGSGAANEAITAAISAAVNEYGKSSK